MSLKELVYRSITAKKPVESCDQVPVRSTTISQFAIALEYNPRATKSSFMNYYVLTNPHYVLPNGLTMLSHAVVNLDMDFLKTLLDHGMDVNAKDKHGRSPLSFVVKESVERESNPIYREIVKMLIDAGAELGALDAGGWTALHYLAGRRLHCTDIDQLIISRGLTFRNESDDYETRCQIANEYNEERMEMAELLISNGADLLAKNGDLPTPYALAEECGDEDFMDLYW
jgi:ankyrin repeat protein